VWVFGYGSLIWRPDFPFTASRDGWTTGWARRFWQGSPDHRGVPAAPGRVVTLVPSPSARVFGRLYRVSSTTLAHLDFREKAGYSRHRVSVETAAGPLDDVLLYVAEAGNPSWLGPASLGSMAAQVIARRGPSGTNVEYVRELAAALTRAGVSDPAVRDLAAAIASPPAPVIVLTTCTEAKDPSPDPLPARARYRSPRLDHVGEAAAAAGLPLVILSGKVGLLAATDPVEYYDQPLRQAEVPAIVEAVTERLRAWGVERVIAHLRPRESPGCAPYHDALEAGCAAAGAVLDARLVDDGIAESPPP